MFINQNFVAIIFKFINFFAIIGIAYFVYKKYLKSDIFFLIAQEESNRQDLLTLQTTLENKQRALDLLAKQETLQCQDFRSKIDTWKKIVTIEQEKEKKAQSAIVAQAIKRKAGIFLKKENQRVQNHILNAVITDLEKSLSHDFKNSQKNTDYLNAILHFMNEKIS